MFRLTISNGLEIDASNHTTLEEAQKAMARIYESMGEPEDEDSSYLGEMGAFHQGEDECNVFDISEIPNGLFVKDMSAKEILDALSGRITKALYEALKQELKDGKAS